MAKPELDYFDTEIIPWKPIKGSPGQYEKILSSDPETGSYTRLLFSEPDLEKLISEEGRSSGRVLLHDDMWEEVFVVKGTIFDITLNKTSRAGYYACRPPGMKHGPEIRTKAKMAKPELEFFNTEVIPWKPIKGSPGQYEKILSTDVETGSFTRLLLSQPDFEHCIQDYKHSPGRILCHEDMWEEVFVVKGTIFDITLNKTSRAGYYACRPPGMKHGPLF